MKKLFLTLGLASLFMVACNNTPKQDNQEVASAPVEAKTAVVEEEHNCPMQALKEEYAKWDEMTDEAKANLNQRAIKQLNEMDAQMEKQAATLGNQITEQVETLGNQIEKQAKTLDDQIEKQATTIDNQVNKQANTLTEKNDELKAECDKKKAECDQKCAEMKAAWDNVLNLGVDEQKDLIMKRLGGCDHGDKPCCKGEGEHKCQHEGEEGHKCQHAAE